MEIKEFRIRYIGTEPFDKDTLLNTLINNDYDREGILEVEEIETTIEICSACNGIGNVDEGAGFDLDCDNCGGIGYI